MLIGICSEGVSCTLRMSSLDSDYALVFPALYTRFGRTTRIMLPQFAVVKLSQYIVATEFQNEMSGWTPSYHVP